MVDIVVTTGSCSVLYREDHNHSAPPASATAHSLSKDATGTLAKTPEAALDASSLASVPALFPLLSGSKDLATSAALAAALAAAAAAAATTAATSGSGDEQLLPVGMSHGAKEGLGGSKYEILGHSRPQDPPSPLQPLTGAGPMPLGDLTRTPSPTQPHPSVATLPGAGLVSLSSTSSLAQASQKAQHERLASSLAACISLLSGEANQRAQGSAPGMAVRDSLSGASPLERLNTASSMACSGELSPSASASSLLAARHLLQAAQQQQEGTERAESWQRKRMPRSSPLPYALLRHALVASFQAGASKATEHTSCSEGSYAVPSPRAFVPLEAADSSGSAPHPLDVGTHVDDSPGCHGLQDRAAALKKAAQSSPFLHDDAPAEALKRKSPDTPMLEAASAGSDEEGSGESRLRQRTTSQLKKPKAQADLALTCQGGGSCTWLAVGTSSRLCNCFCS